MNLSDVQIKNGWKVVKLGDLTEVVTKGTTPSTIKREFKESGVNFIKSECITKEGFIDLSYATFIDEETNKLLGRSIIKEKDILFSIAGMYLAKTGIVKKEHLPANTNQAVAIIRMKHDLVNYKFINYYFKNKDFVEMVYKFKGQSAQPNISLGDIKSFEIFLPPNQLQNSVAKILSTYDDLIENNEKRIKILESMAQKLYTEWFVRFKFPGHEKVKMVDSGHPDFGMIPEGWNVLKILDIGKVVTGKTPSTTNQGFYGGNVLFIKTPDIHGNIFITESVQTLSDEGVKNQNSKTLPVKTVFVSCIGTIGSVGITSQASQTNQQINAIISKNGDDYIYLYFFVSGLKEKLINLGSNGATMGNVNKDKFENINLLYPERKIMDNFFEQVKDFFDEILNLQKQNKNLKNSRDILIPQLVTGKINL